MAKARVHLFISGLVQGVCFRQLAADEARLRGLRGWVRNLPDGRVEAQAEGERQVVEALVEWCRKGPRGARVEELEVRWASPTGEDASFVVRR